MLPDALVLSTSRDRKMARSLQPTIEDAIRSSTIPADQVSTLTNLAHDLHTAEKLSRLVSRSFGIRIVGHTDASGSEKANLKLSRARAQVVRRFLIDNANLNITMMAVGMGSIEPAGEVLDDNLRAKSRFVGFEIVNDADIRQKSN